MDVVYAVATALVMLRASIICLIRNSLNWPSDDWGCMIRKGLCLGE
jgi:hypothetical protein